MTPRVLVTVQPPCVVCGTDRQMRECRPGTEVGPVRPCRACTGEGLPVVVLPWRVDVPAGAA